ncbi:MAG: 30S ribosomal protein S20 [Rhodothermales bacterium]|nr:30S ribosomal protein S20 [Rhodothermales bacterium]
MPQHKSAEKRVRQTEKRRTRNRLHRSRMRTLLKKLVATTDKAEATDLLNTAKAYLDRLAAKGIIHKNKAANTKSTLDRSVAAL